VYLGVLIGAVTLSGSVIAFGKLSGKIGGKPLLLPGAALAEPRRTAAGRLARICIPARPRHPAGDDAASRS
jgi:NAD/NADP transhydrogenase beta subunit